MDRAIVAPRARRIRRAAVATAAVLAVGAALWLRPAHRSLRVERDRVAITEVTRGPFEDFLPLTGSAAPPRSVFLDVPEGGRVERVLVEPGAAVTAGELLIQLSNPALQLDVISREAQVTEQLNNLRNTELALAQARLQQESALIDVDTELERDQASTRRLHALWDLGMGAVPTEQVEESDRLLRYHQHRREFLLKEQAIGDRLRHRQLEQLASSTTMLQKHLEFARDHLRDLEVRAPFSGTLSSLDVQLGQSLSRGQRTGQIDLPGPFKLVAHVDQFYAARVAIAQVAKLAGGADQPAAPGDNLPCALRVTKIYPLVEQGQFTIDLEFTTPAPANLRRGQLLQIRLFVGQTAAAVLVPNAAFAEHTGGRWVFVVSRDGRHATRRAIELGRRNPRYLEVVAGLVPGERIVTSSYALYAEIDELELD